VSLSLVGFDPHQAGGDVVAEAEQQVSDISLRSWLIGLAATAHERGYWPGLRKDLPEDFHEFLSVEAALVALRQVETMVVPGLLQTAEYTRALINGANPGMAFGAPSVMRGQLHRLLDTAVEGHVTLQMLAKSAGASPALNGPFSVLTLPDPIPDFGSLSSADSLGVIREAVKTYE